MKRHTSFDSLYRCRASLEARGEYIASDNLLKAVYRSINYRQVMDAIERARVAHDVPYEEVYGKDTGQQ